MIYQIVYLLLIAMSLGATLAHHGQKRKPTNFWHSVISASISLFLLYKGGFFNVLFN